MDADNAQLGMREPDKVNVFILSLQAQNLLIPQILSTVAFLFLLED